MVKAKITFAICAPPSPFERRQLRAVMGKLNLLHHKSYHPYKADNVAKVKADEAKAAALEDEDNRRTTLAVRPLASLRRHRC